MPKIGFRHSKETLEKMSASHRGKRHSEETKRKLSKANLGKRHSEESLIKMSLAQKGNKNCLGHRHSEESRRLMSESRRGKPLSEETKKKISAANLGKRNTEEANRKIAVAHRRENLSPETRELMSAWQRGERNSQWRGGITPENVLIRTSVEGIEWRIAVFSRDNCTCQFCGKRGGIIHAHHVKSFSEFPNLRFDVDNGVTLCKQCHGELHAKLRKERPAA